ncbi:hypothetical protein ACI3EY_13310 [Ornithinimicrobium sp. LYQ92]|uniref:YqeB family protein n=1 Tax=Serinicoccus sp. LYQ92 TaxID=3378798 RepID=UPI00385509F1
MHSSLGLTGADKAWTYALLGGGGLALFAASPWLARWLAEVPFVPFGGALDWVGGLDQGWLLVVRPLVGLLLGLVAAMVVIADEYGLEVHDDAVVVVHGEDRRTVPRADIVGIHRDGKTVHIDGQGGRVIFAKSVDAGRDAVREAFVSRGYPYESS